MVDQHYTTAWDADTSYTLPVKSGQIIGSAVHVVSANHWLETGDTVDVEASDDFSDLGGISLAVTKVDGDNFYYTLTSTPTSSFPSPMPGRGVELWLTCAKYSAPIYVPTRIRVEEIDSSNEVDLETLAEDGTWTLQKSLDNAEGNVDLIFDEEFQIVRFKQTTGTSTPTVIVLHETAEDLSPTADNVYHIPIEESGTLPDVGTPGTYDIVTTNEKGQVVSGVPVGSSSENIYAEFTNADSVNIQIGQPVYKASSTTVKLARGTTTERRVIGIAAQNIIIGETGNILTEGTLVCTGSQWNLVVGSTTLNDGNQYFLSFTSAGDMTDAIDVSAAPSNAYLVSVGYALSTTEFKLEIEPPIKVS